MQPIATSQSSPEIPINENFQTLEHQAVYGLNQPLTSGLTWGYCDGRWGGYPITAGTLALTASSDNYIVVAVASGVISVSTTNTNWNDATNYVRVYKVTTGGAAVSAVEDHRAGPGGVHGGTGTGGGGGGTETLVLSYALSDRTTGLTTGTDLNSFHAMFDFTLVEVQTEIDTVSSSGLVTVDVKKNGSTALSTLCSIDASEKTSITAATPAVISTTAFVKGNLVSFDLTAAGTGAKGLAVNLVITKP